MPLRLWGTFPIFRICFLLFNPSVFWNDFVFSQIQENCGKLESCTKAHTVLEAMLADNAVKSNLCTNA